MKKFAIINQTFLNGFFASFQKPSAQRVYLLNDEQQPREVINSSD